jgi:hypothetical protein
VAFRERWAPDAISFEQPTGAPRLRGATECARTYLELYIRFCCAFEQISYLELYIRPWGAFLKSSHFELYIVNYL